MGKDAARQTADTAGHDGPITSGSSNVSTGGFPAARMGDKAVCGKKSLPPTQGPRLPEYHYVTIAKYRNNDGLVNNPNGSSDSKTYVGYAVSALSDEDSDGQYDTSSLKAGTLDFQLSHLMGDSGTNFNLGAVIGKVEMNAGTISNVKQLSGTYGVKATRVSINTGGSSGKENSVDYKNV